MLTRTHLSSGLVILIMLFVFPFTGMAQPPGAQATDVVITVASGDTLAAICEQYLANVQDCQSIIQLNQIRNPDIIRPNQTLRIPLGLLKAIPHHGTITHLVGTAEGQAQGDTAWHPLTEADPIPPGYRIKTGPESSVTLTFADGSTVLIKSDTVIDVVRTQKLGPVDFLQEFFLEIGDLVLTIQRATGREPRLKIRTPSAITAVRGTTFRMGVNAQARSRTETLDGTTEVAAMNQSVQVPQGYGTIVKPGESPLPPRRLLPPPTPILAQPLYRTQPALLQFDAVNGAQAYQLSFSRNPDGSGVIEEATLSTEKGFDLAALDDGIWYFQVLSIDELQLQGLPSDPVALTLQLRHPQPPDLQAPQDGSTYAIASLPLTWREAPDAVRYHLQIAEDSSFTTLTLDRNEIKSLSTSTRPLAARAYFIRMRSIADDGHPGPWSSPVRVSVAAPPTLTLRHVEADPSRLAIHWTENGPNMTYDLQVAGDPDFAIMAQEHTVDTTRLTIEKPTKAGTYYVRVRSRDAQGYQGEFSAPHAFDVKGTPIGVIILIGIVGLALILAIVKHLSTRGQVR